VFGVPAVLFSTDSMADNNYQNAQRDLITNLITPLLCTLRDELNRVLSYTEDVYIDFDVTALPELQRDFSEQVTALKQADWLTFNEKRIAIGYDPLPDEMFESCYVASSLMRLDQVGMDLTDDDTSDDTGSMGKVPNV
jgi:phage portal protein BeeE